MGFLTNIWTRYTDRTSDATKDNVLTNMQAEVPEITDHSLMNLFVKIVGIFSGIAELLHYYIDNAAREAQMDGARIFSNVVKLARAHDYRISPQVAASVVLTFEYTSTTTIVFPGAVIPAGAYVSTADGKLFRVAQSLTLPAGNFQTARGQISAVNITSVPSFTLATGTGQPNQQYVITDKVDSFSVKITISSFVWTSVETLAYSSPLDRHFVQTVNEDGQVVIIFGDSVNGQIPPNATAILCTYFTTDGEQGNVESLSINTIVSGVPAVANYTASVFNAESAAGGRGVEPITTIKQNCARSNRTRLRGVTPLDYEDLARLVPSVAASGVIFTCGKTVSIYVVPNGGGLASPALLASVVAYFDDKRIITHKVVAESAGEVRIKASIKIIALPGFDLVDLATAVEDAWEAFFATENQEISGAVNIGDLYQTVEAVNGVRYSEITLLNAEPYARPSATTLIPLDWTVEVLPPNTLETTWGILIISATDYQLFKNNNYQATYTIGALVSLPEIEFTVNASTYTVGDRWNFVTYPYGGNSVLLNEPSIPVSSAADIILTLLPSA